MVVEAVTDVLSCAGVHSHLALERRAAEALSARDFTAALKYADRRIRIAPPPAAHCFVLHAEAAWRLGLEETALNDLEQALLVDPSDVGANRRMLAWATDDRRPVAAARLISRAGNPAILRAAITELRRAGGRYWSACTVFDNHVTGWVAWTKPLPVELSLAIDTGTLTSILEPNPFHPLASADLQATTFLVRRPPSTRPQIMTLRCGGAIIHVRRVMPNLASSVKLRPASGTSARIGSNADLPTVIIPVYGDVQATIECFESLEKARRPGGSGANFFHVLVIDDACPDVELKSYLRELAAAGKIRLLVNDVNLGFVGAINRALKEVSRGDVVLLNADTLVPPGFVGRLAAIAHSAPNIGTVTPLSNNGDIFSFPTPNDVNPMPGYDEVIAIDRAASTAADAKRAIDVVSGIGFCLYVTRACLDRVDELSDNFERGYLEDVDLCLRARSDGFRNVCAPSVYVGHHGSKSFRQEKRGLVLRNLGILDQRFPNYREECRAFEIADPLRPARARLERALPWPATPSVLVVASDRTCPAVTDARIRHSLHDERTVLFLRERDTVHLRAADGGLPQAMRLSLGTKTDIAASRDILTRLCPRRVEILDTNPPPGLIELIRSLDLPIAHWLVSESPGAAEAPPNEGIPLLVPTIEAKAYAERRWPDRAIALQDWPTFSLALPPSSASRKSLIVVPSAPSPTSLSTIRALADRFWQRDPSQAIVVAGATCGDDRLMSRPNLFVTGAVAADELSEALAPHNPAWFLTGFEQAVFGHPLVETAKQAARPVAYRDWSGGSLKPRKGDLAIAAGVDANGLADLVVDWVARS
jgi:O-antigen biosynthesis protein